jgi:glutathione S-transferase
VAQYKLNILRPSVNNLSARIFVRAAGLDVEETDVWGKTMEAEYTDKYVPHLTPTLEDPDLPTGTLGESCAIMAYLSNKHDLDQFYPTDPGERAMVDNAMLYHTGTFYPYLARATYPTLGFPQYAGEVGPSEAGDDLKAQAVKDATDALADPLNAFEKHFLRDRKFIGGDRPSIADIRLAATLEFLRAIDFEFPAWAEEYMTAAETTLGDAYSEPAADVRGYVAQMKSQVA